MNQNSLIGFGELPGAFPAEMVPVTQADLEARLAAQDKRYVKGALLIGGGAMLLAIAAAWWMRR